MATTTLTAFQMARAFYRVLEPIAIKINLAEEADYGFDYGEFSRSVCYGRSRYSQLDVLGPVLEGRSTVRRLRSDLVCPQRWTR